MDDRITSRIAIDGFIPYEQFLNAGSVHPRTVVFMISIRGLLR
jgi:hypothetical protein